MIARHLTTYLQHISAYFPVISLTGPRQSGKTTLTQIAFPDHEYHNLEDPGQREMALNDPRAFLKNGTLNMIIDEAQYAPHLFSYIQVLVDEKKRNAQFILSGSQNFLLMQKITQSLAGRVAVLHLLPLSTQELFDSGLKEHGWEHYAFQGGYPAPVSQQLNPKDFYPYYIQSYIERDIRQLINVQDLERFRTFLSLCAGRVGQQVNLSSLGTEIGIDSKTVSRWLSVLETSFIIYRLPQFHRNFGKRLIKSPKLYFYDTGLGCYLLGIKKKDEILNHYAKGALFENFIIADLFKNSLNAGDQPRYYYMRDNTGHEIDLITEQANQLIAVELKSGATVHPDFFKNLEWLQRTVKGTPLSSYVIYSGELEQAWPAAQIVPWNKLPVL